MSKEGIFIISWLGLLALFSNIWYIQFNRRAFLRQGMALLPFPFFRYFYWYIQVSTAGIVVLAQTTNHSSLLKVHNSLGLAFAGLVLATLAMVLFVASMRHLGRNYSPCYQAMAPASLVASGPYRLVRHPVYCANLTLMLGVFLACGSLLVLVNTAMLLFLYNLVVGREEQELEQHFPEYSAYKARTGRFWPRWRPEKIDRQ